MNGHEIALVSLVVTILVLLLTSTWRISALSTKVADAIDVLEKKDKQLEEDIKAIKAIPVMENRLGMLEKNLVEIPARVVVLEQKAQHSKEMRKVLRQSNPEHNKGDE